MQILEYTSLSSDKFTQGRFILGSDLEWNKFRFRTKSLGVDTLLCTGPIHLG